MNLVVKQSGVQSQGSGIVTIKEFTGQRYVKQAKQEPAAIAQ